MRRDEVRVLVVEDEEIIRLMFKQSFENWGFQVDVAENGQIALDKCHHEFFHIIVTDLNMPVMNGMDLLKRVKDKWPYVEVIVVTGYATIESAIESLKAGAYDFILKPVNFDHVQFTVNKCFTKIRAESENEELKEANLQLSELNEMKDKFLYITNHEIRTPLTIIKGYLDILQNLVVQRTPEVQETLDILGSTISELSELVDRMHLLQNLEQGKISQTKKSLDLKSILSKVYRELAKLYNARNINLKVNVDKKPLTIMGEYRQIRLIIRELMQNALKFTPDGGSVTVKLELKNDEIQFTVQDTGVGIPYDKQNLIFDRFYEIQDVINHKTSKKEFMGGGLGIGLSMVKEIVNEMKGSVELVSEVGKGSLFKVILPQNPSKSESESQLNNVENINSVSTK
jgi:signal transduction histidine kinase